MTNFTQIHPDFQGLDAIYATKVSPLLDKNEDDRLKALKRRKQLRWSLHPLAVLFSIAMILSLGPFGGLFLAFLAISGIEFLANLPLKSLKRKLQSEVLPLIAKAIGFDFQHQPVSVPHFETFKKYKVIPKHDRRRFEDLLHGERHDLPFDIYEAYLERENTDSDGDTTWTTVFHGIMLRIEYPRAFLGKTILKRDSKFLKFSPLGKEFKRIDLSSPKFEKAFDAWTTDQTEAHYLLDPLKLERFLALEKIYHGKGLTAAFADGALLIAIKTGDILSIGNMKTPLEDMSRIETILREFAAIYDLIDVMVKPVEGKLSAAFEVSDIREAPNSSL